MSSGSDRDRHVVFVQYGDYGETVKRFAAGRGETYGSQRYSVEAAAGLADRCGSVTVVCVTAGPYDEVLSNGVRGVGLGCDGGGWEMEGRIIGFLSGTSVTDLIVRTPKRGVIRWAVERGVRVLPVLADSFTGGWKRWWRNRRLAGVLNRREIEWVADHNIGSCRTLERIGVDPGKIIPWDWPRQASAKGYEAKGLRAAGSGYRMIYVGAMSMAKGVGEAIEAAVILRGEGLDVSLTAVGERGEIERLKGLAERLGVAGHVRFPGTVEHGEVVRMMNEHDVVVVPSRHEYAEGFPKTINEALASRTPLVVSDHPAFVSRLRDGRDVAMFEGGAARSLAAAVRRVLTDSALYRRLSEGGPGVLERIECKVKWGELIEAWLFGGERGRAWLAENTLARLEGGPIEGGAG